MRHSKSCSNLLRDRLGHEISQELRDPGLTEVGRKMAIAYGPLLRKRLQQEGLDPETSVICSSFLRRANETASLLFNRHVIKLALFAENGAIPENTPAGDVYQKPDWEKVRAHLEVLSVTNPSASGLIIVGHGSFLRDTVWPAITGHTINRRLKNLDGILVDMETGSWKSLRYTGYIEPDQTGDRCQRSDIRKVATLKREMTVIRGKPTVKSPKAIPVISKQRRTRRQQQQRGGATSMPLAYFKDGAQMVGTYADPTGVAASAGANWVRAPLNQTGGRRRSRNQSGGFSPSVMGGFATTGMRLIPVAAYMGYKMFSNKKQTRRNRKSRRS